MKKFFKRWIPAVVYPRAGGGGNERSWKWLPAFAGMTLTLLFSSWLMFHTFSYDVPTHSIKIAFKLWSDFGAHIPLVRSFFMGDNLDRFVRGTVQYPIFPGEPIRYHYLFYLFVGLLEKIGVRIDWALNVPSILGFTILLISLYTLARSLTRSTAVAVLTVLFFLFNGSLGFIRFFTLHPISFQTLSDIIHAKDFPAFAPWGPGEVSAFWNLNIYTNQRHLAVAFALLIGFILTCLHLVNKPFKKQMPWILLWGITFGALPFFHQPTLLIAALVMGTYLIFFPKLRVFLLVSGLITTALVIPQLWFAKGASNPIEWYPGYIIHNEILKQSAPAAILHMITFWWQNIGLHGILILVGFFCIPSRARRFLLPIIPVFVIPNLFKFSVEASANHKFFNFALMLGNMISAYLIITLCRKVWQRKNKVIALLVTCLLSFVTFFLILSGIIDFFVIANDTKGSVTDIPKNEIATWIRDNTPTNSVFLNSSYLYHPASLAGRYIFLGWPYFAWSAGYKENRMPIMKSMYEGRNAREVCSLLSKYHISYVTVEDVKNDPNLPRIDLAYYLKTYTPSFTSHENQYAIFSTQEICKKK